MISILQKFCFCLLNFLLKRIFSDVFPVFHSATALVYSKFSISIACINMSTRVSILIKNILEIEEIRNLLFPSAPFRVKFDGKMFHKLEAQKKYLTKASLIQFCSNFLFQEILIKTPNLIRRWNFIWKISMWSKLEISEILIQDWRRF